MGAAFFWSWPSLAWSPPDDDPPPPLGAGVPPPLVSSLESWVTPKAAAPPKIEDAGHDEHEVARAGEQAPVPRLPRRRDDRRLLRHGPRREHGPGGRGALRRGALRGRALGGRHGRPGTGDGGWAPGTGGGAPGGRPPAGVDGPPGPAGVDGPPGPAGVEGPAGADGAGCAPGAGCAGAGRPCAGCASGGFVGDGFVCVADAAVAPAAAAIAGAPARAGTCGESACCASSSPFSAPSCSALSAPTSLGPLGAILGGRRRRRPPSRLLGVIPGGLGDLGSGRGGLRLAGLRVGRSGLPRLGRRLRAGRSGLRLCRAQGPAGRASPPAAPGCAAGCPGTGAAARPGSTWVPSSAERSGARPAHSRRRFTSRACEK